MVSNPNPASSGFGLLSRVATALANAAKSAAELFAVPAPVVPVGVLPVPVGVSVGVGPSLVWLPDP